MQSQAETAWTEVVYSCERERTCLLAGSRDGVDRVGLFVRTRTHLPPDGLLRRRGQSVSIRANASAPASWLAPEMAWTERVYSCERERTCHPMGLLRWSGSSPGLFAGHRGYPTNLLSGWNTSRPLESHPAFRKPKACKPLAGGRVAKRRHHRTTHPDRIASRRDASGSFQRS